MPSWQRESRREKQWKRQRRRGVEEEDPLRFPHHLRHPTALLTRHHRHRLRQGGIGRLEKKMKEVDGATLLTLNLLLILPLLRLHRDPKGGQRKDADTPRSLLAQGVALSHAVQLQGDKGEAEVGA